MKDIHMLSLLQSGFTTVDVRFLDSAWGDNEPRNANNMKLSKEVYTYKVMEVLGLKEDDLVVVPARQGFAVAKVAKVDETPQIDVDATYPYRWIVSKLDMVPYERLQQEEKDFAEIQREVRREQEKRSMFETILKDMPADSLAVRKFNAMQESHKQTIALLEAQKPSVPAPPVDNGGAVGNG